MCFPGGARGKEPDCQCRRHKRHGFDPWVGKIPWRRAWRSTLVFLPGESHGRGTWKATVHHVTQSWTWLKRLHTHQPNGAEVNGYPSMLPMFPSFTNINTRKILNHFFFRRSKMENGLNLENKTDLISQLVNTGIKEIQNDLTKIKIKKYYQSYVFFR